VRSRAGRGGGHFLEGSPEDISLLSVIRAIDEQIDPLPCLSTTAYVRCRDCDDEATCTTRHLFIKIQEQQSALLSHVTLASVMPKPRMAATPAASPKLRTPTHPVLVNANSQHSPTT
jgi:DNA-binding IscR family transcriptional regulator